MTDRPPAPPRSRWLLRPPAPDAAVLLFCLPYPGTGASLYHRWPRQIGPAEVCPVQLPGRESRLREAPYTTYASAAEALVAGLRPYLDRPYAIFSHCGSVFLGYEVSLLIERLRLPAPVHFFASSAMPPHAAATAQILEVPEEELGGVVESLMRARGLEPSPELVELSLGALRADVGSHRGYCPVDRARLPCRLTAIGWSDDDQVPPDDVAGWCEYGDASYVILEGTHWSFLDAPAELRGQLERALAPVSAVA